ncbi:Bacterial extracellular solute-binding protein [compost metagenome]
MRTLILITNLFLVILLVGCSKETSNSFSKDSHITLNIGYINEDQFKKRFDSLLSSEFPNIRFNVVSTKPLFNPSITPSQFIQDNQVDLMLIHPNRIQEFINEGLLTDIEPLIARDQLDLNQFVPSIIELTRSYGNGKIYGLPLNFNGRVIVYNKDLFDEFKVDYPKDRMTWEDILRLANKFSISESSHSELKGITLNSANLLDLIQLIGNTEGLQVYNSKQQQVSINGQRWIAVWEDVIEANKMKSLDLNVDLNTYLAPFQSGQRAMAVITYDEYKKLEQENPTFRWSTVTMPINSSEPDRTRSLQISDFFAISNSSNQKEAGWEILKFLNSEVIARWEYRSDYGFSTLQNQLVTNDSYKDLVAPFYKLSPNLVEFDQLPVELQDRIRPISVEIMDGNISLSEGLDLMQKEAEGDRNVN